MTLPIAKPYPINTLPPVRRVPVLYVGVPNLAKVLAQGHLDLARTETPGVMAVCMTRCHRIAMLFANSRTHKLQGGVVALDAQALKARMRITPHRDNVLTTKTRALGYDECEERAHAPVPLTGILLGAWESGQANHVRSVLLALDGDPTSDDGVDWDDAFSEANCADSENAPSPSPHNQTPQKDTLMKDCIDLHLGHDGVVLQSIAEHADRVCNAADGMGNAAIHPDADAIFATIAALASTLALEYSLNILISAAANAARAALTGDDAANTTSDIACAIAMEARKRAPNAVTWADMGGTVQ